MTNSEGDEPVKVGGIVDRSGRAPHQRAGINADGQSVAPSGPDSRPLAYVFGPCVREPVEGFGKVVVDEAVRRDVDSVEPQGAQAIGGVDFVDVV